MIDQEKLIKELESRSKKAKMLEQDYREHDEIGTAEAWFSKRITYDEIVSDIKKGRFNIKQKK